MKNVFRFLVFGGLALAAGAVAAESKQSKSPAKKVWNFDNLDGWKLYSQDSNPNQQCSIEKGCLKIFTRAGSDDRKKASTVDQVYTTGRYKWRTYVPKMGVGDQASVGSWIYCDDQHEIDFEVGYGKKEVRDKLGAKPGDLVAYMTTQAHPFSSVPVLITPGWHTFEIDLSNKGGKYHVQWLIDGKVRHSLTQTFGPEFAFRIYCSVENLKFLGDRPASQDNYGLFDKVEYTYHD
ncbi:hypothetical protein ICN84_01320 [Akkermansia glycaniphila]|uniref:hypothetical protein n=1 Tax=Akkermansia glycaniphila TaxID=1679444 RepID=UPI001C00F19C|nr:hypothetical protein [Akkermansia glycaniphila]MBT9448710.1 hypothetical protein [Akkermansia glycaniphila]